MTTTESTRKEPINQLESVVALPSHGSHAFRANRTDLGNKQGLILNILKQAMKEVRYVSEQFCNFSI